MGDEDKPTPLKQEILDKIAALITAAFGLVAALAWNDAIKAVFKEIFGTADAIGPMLAYAISITIIAVILTLTVARAASRAKSLIFLRKKYDFGILRKALRRGGGQKGARSKSCGKVNTFTNTPLFFPWWEQDFQSSGPRFRRSSKSMRHVWVFNIPEQSTVEQGKVE